MFEECEMEGSVVLPARYWCGAAGRDEADGRWVCAVGRAQGRRVAVAAEAALSTIENAGVQTWSVEGIKRHFPAVALAAEQAKAVFKMVPAEAVVDGRGVVLALVELGELIGKTLDGADDAHIW
jgi:hypothetical protein